jgi:tetratricopeptide (TPR) repeat protein
VPTRRPWTGAEQAAELARPAKHALPLCTALLLQARALAALYRWTPARERALEALRVQRESGAEDPAVVADGWLVLASIALQTANLPGAETDLQNARQLSAGPTRGDRRRRARASLLESRLQLTAGRYQAALAAVRAAVDDLAVPDGQNDVHHRAEVLAQYGVCLCAADRQPQGRATLKKALELRERLHPEGSPLVDDSRLELARCPP